MRGKVAQIQYRQLVQGITPAYAGKRDRFPQILHGFRDHPRLCGEKLSCVAAGR